MRVTQLFGTTLRQVQTDSPFAVQALLLRAGFIREQSSGKSIYLHLGLKSVQQIFKQFQSVIHPLGAVEISLSESSVLPEEQLAQLAGSEIASYKQLPKWLYQFTPERGLLEVWTFAKNTDELTKQMDAISEKVFRVLKAVDLPFIRVDDTIIKEEPIEKVMALIEGGKDRFFLDVASKKYSTPEAITLPKELPGLSGFEEIEEVYTPNSSTIEALARFLGVRDSQTAKVVFFMAERIGNQKDTLVIAVVRGDREANEAKIKAHLNARDLRPATEEEITKAECVPGFASPVGIDSKNALVIADEEIVHTPNLVAGANRKDYHLLNVCYGRDFEAEIVADIVHVKEVSEMPNGSKIEPKQGLVLGKVVEFNSRYANAFDATYMDEHGRPAPVFMGKVEMDLRRILLAIGATHHDEWGLCWPASTSPYSVMLISLADGPETIEYAEALYDELQVAGISVLYDDRPKKMAGPGVKFKDADLRGFPIRITVSKKTLAENSVELKLRTEEERTLVLQNEVIEFIRGQNMR